MNAYRTSPPVFSTPVSLRSRLVTALRNAVPSMKRYAAGIIPIAAAFGAFSVGRFFWVTVLGFNDWLEASRIPWPRPGHIDDPSGWCFMMWVMGMCIIASPIWAPRLGNKVILGLWPKEQDK